MTTTTFQLIRAQQIAVLRALVPLRRAGERFETAPTDEPLESYAGRDESMAAVFRQFQIRDGHDDEQLQYCDLQTIRVAHTVTIDVAYPKLYAKYGQENLMSMDDVIRSDFHQIDQAIGVVGYASWVPGQHACDHRGGNLFDVGPAAIRRLIFRVEYERSLT